MGTSGRSGTTLASWVSSTSTVVGACPLLVSLFPLHHLSIARALSHPSAGADLALTPRVSKTPVHKLLAQLFGRTTICRPHKDRDSDPIGREPLRYPIYCVNILCDPGEYDICFEPAKAIVEFRDWSSVLRVVETSAKECLTRHHLFDSPLETLATFVVGAAQVLAPDSAPRSPGEVGANSAASSFSESATFVATPNVPAARARGVDTPVATATDSTAQASAGSPRPRQPGLLSLQFHYRAPSRGNAQSQLGGFLPALRHAAQTATPRATEPLPKRRRISIPRALPRQTPALAARPRSGNGRADDDLSVHPSPPRPGPSTRPQVLSLENSSLAHHSDAAADSATTFSVVHTKWRAPPNLLRDEQGTMEGTVEVLDEVPSVEMDFADEPTSVVFAALDPATAQVSRETTALVPQNFDRDLFAKIEVVAQCDRKFIVCTVRDSSSSTSVLLVRALHPHCPLRPAPFGRDLIDPFGL